VTIHHTRSGPATPSAAPVQPLVLGLLGLTIGCSESARAALSAEELATLAQNPIANVISVPFQNNTNLNYGPQEGTQNILNIQPVIPITLGKLPANTQLGGYYNAVKPEDGPDWQIRLHVQLMFPK
jgi:hypothetical protein